MSKELAIKIKQNGDEDLLEDAWDFRGSCCPRIDLRLRKPSIDFPFCKVGN